MEDLVEAISPDGKAHSRSSGCDARRGRRQSPVQAPCSRGPGGYAWYALDAAGVAAKLGVGPAHGPVGGRAADLLARNGPNALPVEQPPSTLRRLLAEYTSYMQIILVGAAIVSLVIQQWATAIVLFVITLFNALVGLRQAGQGRERDERAPVDDEGHGAGATRRRGGRDPGRTACSRRRRADRGRRRGAGRRPDRDLERAQIDESALDRRERPGAEGRRDAGRRRDRTRRAVEHGVHAHPGHARQRR